MKIKIYTGVTVEPKSCIFDDLHPKFQIFNFKQLVEQGEDFELTTNSDFIIRELNCLIMEGALSLDNVTVYEDGNKLVGDFAGFAIKSIDDVIEEQNKRSDDLYYKLKYGEE